MTKEQKAFKGIYLNDLPSQKDYVASTSVSCEIDLQSVYKNIDKLLSKDMALIKTRLRFGAKKFLKRRKSLKIIAYNIQALKS